MDLDFLNDGIKDEVDHPTYLEQPHLSPPQSTSVNFALQSAKYSEGLLLGRRSDQRLQPWFLTIPVRQIIQVLHSTLISSKGLEAFHFLAFGKMIVGVLKKLSLIHPRRPEGSDGCCKDQDFDKYLRCLEIIFNRLNSSKDEEMKEEIQSFERSVWNLYANGILDLTGTNIPSLIVGNSPMLLEKALKDCVGELGKDFTFHFRSIKDDGSATNLVALCNGKDNFMTVVGFLKLKYAGYCEQFEWKVCTEILKFGREFQKQLKERMNTRFKSLFPTPFHPLLELLDAASTREVVMNDAIGIELLGITNSICHQCELFQYDLSTFSFILLTNPYCFYISTLETYYNRKRGCLWLRRCCKKYSDFFRPLKNQMMEVAL